MKKLLIFIFAVWMIVGVSRTSFAYPNPITVDSDANGCAAFDSCDSNYASVLSVFFPAGDYIFAVDSGAFLSWNEPGGGPLFPPQYFWGVNIYQPSTSNEYVLGDYAKYATAGDALNANLGKNIPINHPTDGNLLFYVKDYEPRSNEGTLNIAVVPEPVSSSLFIIGGAVFAGRRFLKKKSKS